MKIPFSKYVSTIDEHSNVSDVLDGDDIGQVEKLENELAEYVGVKYALATSHGTSALHLAMLALDLKRGDKVVCSVNSFVNVPEVVRHFDAEPIFIDIEENSYNINLNLLEEYLASHKSKKLKAVIVSHIGGKCVDLDRLYSMAKLYNVKIVEEASTAFGATYKDNKIGATGADIVCFDFSPHLKKNICNGGVLVTDNEEIITRAKLLSNHAINRDKDTLEYIYDVVDIGYDYSLSELNGAYIRAQVKHQEKNIARQKEIAQAYSEAFENLEHVKIPESIDKNDIYSLYIIKIDKNRDSFAMELKNRGIESGLHYIPLHLQSYYKSKYSLRVNDFPVSLRTYQQVLSLPIYGEMSDKDVKFVIKSIKEIDKKRV